jgi:hypothetical protein
MKKDASSEHDLPIDIMKKRSAKKAEIVRHVPLHVGRTVTGGPLNEKSFPPVTSQPVEIDRPRSVMDKIAGRRPGDLPDAFTK